MKYAVFVFLVCLVFAKRITPNTCPSKVVYDDYDKVIKNAKGIVNLLYRNMGYLNLC